MADTQNPHGDDPRFRQNEPKLSRSLKKGNEEFEELEIIDEESTGVPRAIKKLKRLPFFKEHSGLMTVLGGVAAFLAAMLFICWFFGVFNMFGGGQNDPIAPPPVATTNQPPQPTQPAQPQANPPAAPPSQPAVAEQKNDPKTDKAAEVKKSPFPEDVSKWKKIDYYRARRDSDPKLLEAVVFLGETYRGSEPAALGLIELLKPPVPEPPPAEKKSTGGTATTAGTATHPTPQPTPDPAQQPPASQPPRDQAYLTKLVEAIIVALGSNGTPPARKALEQILSGELATDDDKTAVEIAIKTLVLHSSHQNEAILIRVLAEPDVLRPAKREGAWPAKELRQKALEWVKPAASSELRTKLAELLGDRFLKLETSDPIYEFLLVAEPANFGAQATIYQLKGLPDELRSRLEQQLLTYAGGSLGTIIGLHKEGQTAGATDKAELELAVQTASLFWSDKFTAMLDAKISGLESISTSPNLMLLALTIPQDANRDVLAKFLRKHWTDGPASLATGGFPEQLATDPGLLVTLKVISRINSKPASRTTSSASQPRPAPAKPAARGKAAEKAAEAAEALQKKKELAEQAEKDWAALMSKLVTIWCKRLQMAGLAREVVAAESGSTDIHGGLKMPAEFAFAPNVKVISEYHAVWPEYAPAGISHIKPGYLKIHYACIEETKRPKATVGFYARQAQVRLNAAKAIESSMWFDGLRSADSDGRRRSVDVVIRKSEGAIAEALKEDRETEITTEILVIEIKEPGGRD